MEMMLLRSFLSVSRTGAITESAGRLGVTQPALSRRIRQLESLLGARLLERGRNGVTLTETGQLVYEEAEQLVARFDRLRETVAAHTRLEVGTVRLGGGATAVSFLVPPAIAALQRDHENVRFQVKEAGSEEIARDVATEALELGIVTLPVSHPELETEPLFEDRIVLAAAPSHPLAGGTAVTGRQLTGYALVGFEAGSAIRALIDAHLRDAAIDMNVVMELRSIPAILRMVATTGHLAFVSRLGVESDPTVRSVPVDGLHITRQLAVVSRRGRALSPAASAFLDRLRGSSGSPPS